MIMMEKDTNTEPLIEEAPKDKKGLVVWIKEHKKQFGFGGISAIFAVALGLKNKENIKAVYENLKKQV